MLPGPQPPSQQGCPWPSSWKSPSFFEDVNTELIVFFSNFHLALSLGNFSHHADSPFGSGPSIPVLVHLHWFHHRSVSSKLSQSHILNLIITWNCSTSEVWDAITPLLTTTSWHIVLCQFLTLHVFLDLKEISRLLAPLLLSFAIYSSSCHFSSYAA